MFKKQDRFSFGRGLPKSKKVTPYFVVRFQKSDPSTDSASSGPKYAVVTSKKVSKKAVLRNKTKRVFLQALKEILEKSVNEYDLIFFLRLPSHEYQKSGIMVELEKILLEINR